MRREEILEEIKKERVRQDIKFGPNRYLHPAEWLAILTEETGEMAREILEANFDISKLSENYKTELIQIAAVAIAALEGTAYYEDIKPVKK